MPDERCNASERYKNIGYTFFTVNKGNEEAVVAVVFAEVPDGWVARACHQCIIPDPHCFCQDCLQNLESGDLAGWSFAATPDGAIVRAEAKIVPNGSPQIKAKLIAFVRACLARPFVREVWTKNKYRFGLPDHALIVEIALSDGDEAIEEIFKLEKEMLGTCGIPDIERGLPEIVHVYTRDNHPITDWYRNKISALVALLTET